MYNSENICRSCLTTEQGLLRMDSVIDESLKISDCLKIHLNVNITEDDGLPHNMCLDCLDSLLQVRKFHLRYMQSEEVLITQYLKSLHKVEDDDDSMKTVLIASTDENAEMCTLTFVPDVNMINASNAEFVPELGSHLMDVITCNESVQYQIEMLDDNVSIEDIDGSCVTKESNLPNTSVEDINGLLDVKQDTSKRRMRSKSTKIFKCLQCKDMFHNKNKLRSHFHSAHGKDNARGYCIQCSSTFPTRGHLMQHLQTHIDKLKFSCSYCGKQLSGRTKLLSHERTHTGEKPFVCKICNKAFGQSSVLVTHMALHTGKQISCPKCDKKFSRQSFLKVHLRVHDDIRPYACNVCDKKYRMKSHLNSHLLSHSDTRNFTCDTCGQSFKERTILRSHLKIHTRPYKCPKCPLQAAKLYSFRIHLIKMHGIHDDPKLFMTPILPESGANNTRP